MKKKVFVTGAAGFYGINFVRKLLKENCEVVGYDLLEFDYPEKDQITHLIGDIRDVEKLEKVTKDVDFVVHAAAALPLYTAEEIYSTDVEGTKNVIQACLKNKVKRLVHISSTAVYGVPDHHPLVEDDKLIGVGPYGKAKIQAEKECEKAREQGLTVSILRPKSFVGPERLGVFALLYDWAKDGKNFPVIGSGNNLYQLLDVEDLCQATWLCLTGEKEKVNDVFNIGAKEFDTMKEDFGAVLNEAGFGKKIIGTPATPLIWTLRFFETLGISPLYKWVYETAGKDSFVSVKKAEKKLNFTPKYSNKQALVRNYKWYLENLKNFEGQSGVTHRVPWKQGILSLVKKFF